MITIIVLVILVAVSINLILGENGIINKAQNASDETEKAAATETINLKIVTVGGAYFGIIGMFLAVPIVAVVKLLIEDFIEYKESH